MSGINGICKGQNVITSGLFTTSMETCRVLALVTIHYIEYGDKTSHHITSFTHIVLCSLWFILNISFFYESFRNDIQFEY